MTLETNHTAAGETATAARGEVKQSWFKKPIALHFAIGLTAIIIALIINSSFQFNFFWKLLLGMALMWAGKKLTSATIKPVKVWGSILRAVGALMIVLALINSSFRLAAEKAVNSTEEAVAELAGVKSPADADKAKPSKEAKEMELVRRDFSQMQPGDFYQFTMLTTGLVIATKRITQPGEVPIHICFRVKNALADGTEFVVVDDSFAVAHLRLSPDSVKLLQDNNINMINVVGVLVQTHDENPCMTKK